MLSGIPVLQEHLSGPHQSLAETASEAGRTSIMQPQAADVVIIGAGATRICRIGDHEHGRRGDSGPIPNLHRDRFFNGKLRVLQARTCGNECQSSPATGRLPFPARLRYEQQIALRASHGLNVRSLSPDDAKAIVPQLQVVALQAAVSSPQDDYAAPHTVVQC
jgi:hypothetical protein